MDHRYIPPLRLNELTPLFDAFMKHLLPERRIKVELLQTIGAQPGSRILDFGCGTGTLAIMLKLAQPEAVIVGLDIDATALGIARDKAVRHGVDVRFDQYDGASLPYADSSFDYVVSTFAFHHLLDSQKYGALREILRILASGATLTVADFDRSHKVLLRGAFLLPRLLDGLANTRANALGLIPSMLAECGFLEVGRRERYATLFGEASVIQGRSPPSSNSRQEKSHA